MRCVSDCCGPCVSQANAISIDVTDGVQRRTQLQQMAWQSDEEYEATVEVKAAFLDVEQVTLTVQWDDGQETSRWENNGITDEVVGKTDLECTHEKLNLDGSMKDKRIRVYWLPEKEWYFGTISRYSLEDNLHTVKFDDGDEEEYDLLQPEKERPAWETEPFTNQGTECGARFGF